MPKGIPLTKTDIRQRLQDLRNKTALHAIARKRISVLEGIVKKLKAKLTATEQERDELLEQYGKAEEKIRLQEDANKKLRSMLFERQHGKPRTTRPHDPKPRTAASYARPQPKEVTEHKELVLTQCPNCDTPVSDPVSSRTRIIEDIVFNPAPNVVEWTIHRHWCTGCGKQVAGQKPGGLPKNRIRPQTLTLVEIAKEFL